MNRIYLPITKICKNTLKNEYNNVITKNEEIQTKIYNNSEFPNEDVIIQFGFKRRRYQPSSIDIPLNYQPKICNFDEEDINEICQPINNSPPLPTLIN